MLSRSLCSLSWRCRRCRCRHRLRACSLVSRRGTCLNAARSFFREPPPPSPLLLGAAWGICLGSIFRLGQVWPVWRHNHNACAGQQTPLQSAPLPSAPLAHKVALRNVNDEALCSFVACSLATIFDFDGAVVGYEANRIYGCWMLPQLALTRGERERETESERSN